MKKCFIFSLFILGFSSLIGQVILLRELMVSFYGNEFFLGLVLAVWLFWVALGSFWLAKLFKKIKDWLRIVLSCHLLVALFLPLLISLVRLAKTWTPVVGQIPDLLPTLILAIFIPAPLCLILGLQFTATTKHLGQLAQSVNRAYFIESIGFVLAGLFFSYFLVLFNVWLAISLLSFLNCLAVLFILLTLPQRKYLFFKIVGLVLIFVFAALSLPRVSQPLDYQSQSWRFPKQNLIKVTNSPYGQLAVTQSIEVEQYNFYESGLWLASTQELPFNESLAHFTLLFHPQPKNILLIGHGFQGLIKEILKHQPEQVSYLELDPWLIKTVFAYLPSHLQETLQNQKVTILNQDGRYFLEQSAPEKFDLVLINLADPSTALLNRFYTQEFFEEIKNALNQSGIMATYLSFSPNYQNIDLINLEASIYQTLKKVFPEIIILPEEGTILFLAATSKDILTTNSGSLIERWSERNLQTKFINPQYLDYVLTNQRAETLDKILTEEKAKINQDTWPISYAYNFLFWTNYFHPQLADFLRLFLKIEFWWLVALLLILSVSVLLFRPASLRGRRPKQSRGIRSGLPRSPNGSLAMTDKILWLAMAVGGFSLMSVEILLIFAYQSFFGYLYYRLALLIALFMLGLTGGTWLGIKQLRKKARRAPWARRAQKISLSSVVLIHLFILGYLLLLYFFFWTNLLAQVNLFFSRDIIFSLLAILVGGLVGLEFAYVNSLYQSQSQAKQKKAFHPGFIYSADLFGSFGGALLAALFLIPLLGVLQTLLILALINLLMIILLQKPQP